MKERIRVTFCLKEKESNLLVDKCQTFSTIEDAISHIKQIKQQYNLIGKPIIERI